MARVKIVKDSVNGGLPDPWPSAPSRISRYEVTYRLSGRMVLYTFVEAYAAVHMIDVLRDGRDYRWVKAHKNSRDGECIKFEEGDTIESAQLEDLMEYELSPAESEWEVPSPYREEWDRLVRARKEGDAPAPKATAKVDVAGAMKEAAKRVVSTPPGPGPAPAAPARRRAPGGGLVGIATVAESVGMSAKECRGILRKYATKGADGWAWPSSEVGEIEALLRKHRRK